VTRLLLDQGLAPQAAANLRQLGFDAIHGSEIGMEKAEDQLILDRARSEDRVCITLDHDFHAHLAETSHGRPSVVLLRVQGLDAVSQADLIQLVCLQCADALSAGAAVSADRTNIRVRRLPLK
jgi:predicted nuclease of predicted toxin-antitoxin system